MCEKPSRTTCIWRLLRTRFVRFQTFPKKTAARFVMTENAPFRLSSLLLRCLSNLEKKSSLYAAGVVLKKKKTLFKGLSKRDFPPTHPCLITDYFGAVKISRLKSGYELRMIRETALCLRKVFILNTCSVEKLEMSVLQEKKNLLKIFTEQIFFLSFA